MRATTLWRSAALCSVALLSTAASCGDDQQDPVPSGGTVKVQVRYTVTGVSVNNTDSAIPNIGIGTSSYRACYQQSCATGARDLLDRTSIPDGTYTLDLGERDSKTYSFYVAPWFTYPYYRPLRSGAEIKAEVLVEGKVYKTVTLGYNDLTNPAMFTATDQGADLVNEVKIELPQ